tara:strand:+ start:393 stop:566 length:174 start_codon:yes stop_codon:yes gene_type:complete
MNEKINKENIKKLKPKNDKTNKSTTDSKEPGWTEFREQQCWDDFLAWCRAQENGPHE